MKKVLIACAAGLFLASCGGGKPQEMTAIVSEDAKTDKIEQVSWVLGTWKNETAEGVFTEQWEKTSETLYTGHGTLVSPKGDTLFSEYLKLEQVGDTLYYKPVVSGQNDGKETVFTEKSLSDSAFVFENPEHDFPQRIIYKKPTDSTLYARVEGMVDGEIKQEEFEFKKAK